MNYLRAIPAVFAALTLGGCANPGAAMSSPPTLLRGIPVGGLGFPVGTDITIEGTFPYGKGGDIHPPDGAVFPAGGKVEGSFMFVEAVNGRKLAEPVYVMLIEGNGATLPANRFTGRFSVRGYETFKLTGTPPAVAAASKESGESFTETQRGWEVTFEFAPLSSFAAVDSGAMKPIEGPAFSAPHWNMPTGDLGFPLGEYLAIEGVKVPESMNNPLSLKVDRVNGRKLDLPLLISISGKAGDLQDGMRYTVKGYETAGMDGQAPALEAAIKAADPTAPPAQRLWAVTSWFVALAEAKKSATEVPLPAIAE